MSTNTDNPPAFPTHPMEHDHYWHYGESGMTLRDWFAGQAINQLMATDRQFIYDPDKPKNAAIYAYAYADALIEARKTDKNEY